MSHHLMLIFSWPQYVCCTSIWVTGRLPLLQQLQLYGRMFLSIYHASSQLHKAYSAFWYLGLRAHGDIFIQLAPDKLLQKLNRPWLEATWVVQCLGTERCLSQGTSMLVQLNCFQIATAMYAASAGCTQSAYTCLCRYFCCVQELV